MALTGAVLPGTVLLIAAFAKALSAGGLLEVLRALHVPPSLASSAELGLIVAEAAIGAGLVAF